MDKLINLTWEFLPTEQEARKDITDLQNQDETEGNEASDLIDIFNMDYVPFEADQDLKWDTNHPLVIKWKVRINASKDIEDVIIDKTHSVIKSYEEYMTEAKDTAVSEDDMVPNYNYTMNDEIINALREVVIDEYEKEIPFAFNELFTIFIDEDEAFGFDIYQLNASESKADKSTYIIDANSAVKKGLFDKMNEDLQSRVQIKTIN